MTTTIDRFVRLFAANWEVYDYTDWLLVCDEATRYWLRRAEVGAFMAEWDRLDPADEDSRRYSLACAATSASHDAAVPADLVAQAREDFDLADDESVSYGW